VCRHFPQTRQRKFSSSHNFFLYIYFCETERKLQEDFVIKEAFGTDMGWIYYGFEVDGWRTLIFFAVNTLRVNKLFWGKSVWQCWVQCFPYSCVFTSTHSMTSFSSSFIQFIFLHFFIFCTFLCLKFFFSLVSFRSDFLVEFFIFFFILGG